MDHMDLVNKLRSLQAAHSGIQTLNIRSVEDSKAQLLSDCDEVLTGSLHMLSHLEKLEERMLDDLAEKGEAIILLKLNAPLIFIAYSLNVIHISTIIDTWILTQL